jgi:LDH2 family malate/lactate/ureidoglycolate dehydrogenase
VNLGLIFLGLLLVMGSVLGIFMIAAETTPVVYTDTFGTTQGNVTNDTQSTITNVTSPLAGAGSGIALILALFAVAVSGIVIVKFIMKNDVSGRR